MTTPRLANANMLGPVHCSFGTQTGVNIAREYPSKHDPHNEPVRLPPQELNATQEPSTQPNPGGSNANTGTKLPVTMSVTGANILRSTVALRLAVRFDHPQYPAHAVSKCRQKGMQLAPGRAAIEVPLHAAPKGHSRHTATNQCISGSSIAEK